MLSPSRRSAAGYRRYGRADEARLARICRYRRAGLSLAVIKDLLDSPDTDVSDVLAARLDTLNQELRRLREQQRFIQVYLREGRPLATRPLLTVERFVELLTLAGVSPRGRAQWHANFEQTAAEEHQAFLEFLCLPDDEIEQIRARTAEILS